MSRIALFDAGLCWHVTLTLLHVGWLGVVAGVLAAAGNRALRKSSAGLRYWWNAGTLLALGLALPATFAVVRVTHPLPDAPAPAVAQNLSNTPLAASTTPTPADPSADVSATSNDIAASAPPAPVTPTSPTSATAAADTLTLAAALRAAAPAVTTLYLLGVAALLARLAIALYGGQRLRAFSRPVAERDLLDLVARQAQRLALKFVPAVAWCERVAVPVVVGVVRPIVLLPAAMAAGLTVDQLAAVLTHELAHIRRHDHLHLLVQRVIEALLFFHPAVWYLSRRINDERETCCDDLVLAAGGDRGVYVASLLRVAELRLTHTAGVNPPLAGVRTIGPRWRRMAVLPRACGSASPGCWGSPTNRRYA